MYLKQVLVCVCDCVFVVVMVVVVFGVKGRKVKKINSKYEN